jgi:hypothetical protein
MISGHDLNKVLRCLPRLPFLLQLRRQHRVGVRGILHDLRQPGLGCSLGVLQILIMLEPGLHSLLLELLVAGFLGAQGLLMLPDELLLFA